MRRVTTTMTEGEIWLFHIEPAEFDELALWCIEHGVALTRMVTREELEEKWGVWSLPQRSRRGSGLSRENT